MKSGKIISRLFSWFFITMCTAGLLWQLTAIIDQYFRYKVSTVVHVFTPDVIDPLAMTFCVPIHDVLDFKRMNMDLNLKNTYQDKWDLLSDYENLTIRHLFDYVPSNDSTVEYVEYKTKKNSALESASCEDPNWTDKIEIIKFLYDKEVCYKILLKKDEQLRYREVAVTSEERFFLQIFYFNQSFLNVEYLKVMLGPVNRTPYKELISTPAIRDRIRKINGTRKVLFNRYDNYHLTIEKIKLPSPYETNCIQYEKVGLRNQHHCIDDCVANEMFRQFGEIATLSPVTQPSDLKPFILYFHEYGQRSNKVWEIQDDCERVKCRRSECHDLEFVTSTASSLNGDYLKSSVRIASQPSFKINSKESLTFVEFMVYIMGSISTWTGLSVFACNPVLLMRHTLKSMKKSQFKDPRCRLSESLRLNQARRLREIHANRAQLPRARLRSTNTQIVRRTLTQHTPRHL